ncbi:pyrroline-5-carboxylate reductase [Frigoribacterium sp. CFBP 13712]|uniref:pyrroline-5-carboxylate reductase n=1 Tax=Frigoribacterium sp. CFBP 13712 TaxID=2775309 RepID=UPI0017871482|nr:pyrroline-5-carboxylate reductase [Frigoribacterium sp. CFBP 13712]MBD8702660.1 pyrroline-5-carboxylate reductase [Frigoribacterium sp. CFBP 13712]
MVTMLPTTAILGAGSMGGAILSGLLRPGVVVDGGIRVTNRSEAKAVALRHGAVTSLATESDPRANASAVVGANLVLIGVKPHMVVDLLSEIGSALDPGAVVVSLAAGVTTETMEAALPPTVSVLRSMPNTPSVVGLGVTGLSAGSRSTDDDLALARTLFEVVGEVVVVDEDRIDALSTISGSGPAYVFLLIEKLQQAAIGLGFTPAQAATMVQGTFRGASELLAASDVGPAPDAPAELRRRVTSPGGTTERAVAVLDAGGLADLFDRATAAALERNREIAAGR